MGAAAPQGDRVISGAPARMGERSVGKGAGLVGQRRVFPLRQLLDQRAAREAAGFLVRIDHDVIAEAMRAPARLECLQRVEDHAQSALHVGGAGSVHGLVVKPAVLLEGMVGGVDGVHMPRQHHAPFRVGADAQDHVAAMRFFEFGPVSGNGADPGGFDQFDFAGKGGEGVRKLVRDHRQPVEIGGAGIDRRPVERLVEHGPGIDTVEKVGVSGHRWGLSGGARGLPARRLGPSQPIVKAPLAKACLRPHKPAISSPGSAFRMAAEYG